MNRAGMDRSRARSRIPAPATSLRTIATSVCPDRHASAMATKFEPWPEPSTPIRSFVSSRTRVTYRQRPGQTSMFWLLGLSAAAARWTLRLVLRTQPRSGEAQEFRHGPSPSSAFTHSAFYFLTRRSALAKTLLFFRSSVVPPSLRSFRPLLLSAYSAYSAVDGCFHDSTIPRFHAISLLTLTHS